MNGQYACGCGRVPSFARDTRGWYPSPHSGSQTKATVLWSAAEADSAVHLGQQARGPRLVPPPRVGGFQTRGDKARKGDQDGGGLLRS